jgi:hypothetical protein
MSRVFQNIDPPPPSPPGECVPPAGGAGEDTLAGWRMGWGDNILEDAKHSSVLYICKYFVGLCIGSLCRLRHLVRPQPSPLG